MWNKRNDDPADPRPQNEPAPATAPALAAPRPAPPPAPAVKEAKQQAVIGASMAIKGEIRTREDLLLDGEVEGMLESQSRLTVGPHGKLLGNIKAREVAIYGNVRGNVEVSEKIAICNQGSLIGDIKGAGISIDDGAYFKGRIDIVRPGAKNAGKAEQNEPRIVAPAT
ncbi:MAG TPA: polymer-forming cytoskeletal protein [Bryobacteraceae bacterium]|nr:polymer-forming cytoskeletal protein [Bryobacteraceae bacterium]